LKKSFPMTDSPVDPVSPNTGLTYRRFVLPGFAAAMVLVFASLGHAQTSGSGPVRLAPPVQLQPAVKKADPIPEPQAVVPQPAAKVSEPNSEVLPRASQEPGIQVDTLKSISPDTAGVLGPEDGGFDPDMWLGSSGRFIDTMLVRLPINVASTTMRDLMRRLLLTSADLPSDHPGDGSQVVTRVGLLTEMGEISAVHQLLDAIPGREVMDQLVRYEADIRFLANDNARACALAASQVDNFDNAYWQKAFIFCQALAGEQDKAALGVSLLREIGEQDDAFFTLVNRLTGADTPLESLSDPTPLHLSMARAGKVQLPGDVVTSNKPGILRSIATSPNAPVEIRLEAAERAELAGALDVDTLRQLYTSVSFSEQELANPLSRAEAESGTLSRALLYRTALIQTVPVAQAEVVARALALAREGGRYPSTVRVFLPVLTRMLPSTELVWFAPEAIRAFLIAGDVDTALPWFALLKAKAMFDKDAITILEALLPVARLAGYGNATALTEDSLGKWWALNKDKENGPENAALLFSLFEAMGEPVSQESWEELLDGPQRSTVVMPSPALWNRLISATREAALPLPVTITKDPQVEPQAALSGSMPHTTQVIATASLGATLVPPTSAPLRQRFGEALLLSLITIGDGGPGQATPVVLSKVISSLRAIGLETEARALALEAAVAAGL